MSRQAEETLSQYADLIHFQIRPWETNGGEVYKEDMVYMRQMRGFMHEFKDRWTKGGDGGSSVIERVRARKRGTTQIR